MKARHAVLAAIVAAVTVTSVAAAGPEAAKQRVMFTTQAAHTTSVSPFVFTPLQAGALKRDTGTFTGGPAPERVVMRKGQKVSIYDSVGTFEGKLGSLVLRNRSEWVEAGDGYHIASHAWKVVRGTGQYAVVTGSGRGGGVWNERTDRWSSHSEGLFSRG